MKCSSCGINVREGAVYCNKCGSRLIAPQPTAAPAGVPVARQPVAKPQKKSAGALKIIIPAVAVFLVAVIVLLIVFNPFSGKKEDKPVNVTLTTAELSTTAITKSGTLRSTEEDFAGLTAESGWCNLVSVATGESFVVALKDDGTAIAHGDHVDLNDEWKNLRQVSAGSYHAVALKDDGTVVATGDNGYGQCDVEDWKDIVYVAAGYTQTIGVKENGTVVAAGRDADGVMDVEDWKDIVSVSTSEWITLGLKEDGTVVATDYQEEGDFNVDDWEDIVAVSAGCIHAVGIKADGTAIFTGSNSDERANISSWKNLVAISAGGAHTVGLTSDGEVLATGYNRYGQCDVTGWTDIMLPDSAVSDKNGNDSDGEETTAPPSGLSYEKKYSTITAGPSYTIALKNDGSLLVAGDYYYDTDLSQWDNIAEISASNYTVVALRKDGTVLTDLKVDVSDWSGVVDAAAGAQHIVALKKDGTVDMRLSSYADEDYGYDDVKSWTDIVAVSAGLNHTVGLKKDGTVVAAGRNVNGQCNVDGWTDIVAISAGYDHTVGLKSDGTVVATEYIDTEYSLYHGESDVEEWRDIVAVSAGNAHTVGLKKDGTVVVAGNSTFGRLNVDGWTDIVSVSAGDIHTVGLRSDGTAVATEFIADGIHNPSYTGWSDVSEWRDIAMPSGASYSKPSSTVTATQPVAYTPTTAELERLCEIIGMINKYDFKAGSTSTADLINNVLTSGTTNGVYMLYFDDYEVHYSTDYYYTDALNRFSDEGFRTYNADNMAWICEDIFHTPFDENYDSDESYCYYGSVYRYAIDVRGGAMGYEVESCNATDDGKYQIVINQYDFYDSDKTTLETVTVIADLQEIDGEKQWTFYEISSQ